MGTQDHAGNACKQIPDNEIVLSYGREYNATKTNGGRAGTCVGIGCPLTQVVVGLWILSISEEMKHRTMSHRREKIHCQQMKPVFHGNNLSPHNTFAIEPRSADSGTDQAERPDISRRLA